MRKDSPTTSESTSQDISVIQISNRGDTQEVEEHSSLFESLPSVEYRKPEEEFEKIVSEQLRSPSEFVQRHNLR